MHLAVIAAASVLAGAIAAVSGFGIGSLLTPLLLVIALGVTVGTFIGVPILGRIPESAYRRLVGGLLIALGISLIVLTFRT